MSVFAAKLGMALFREQVGHALPEGGAVWSQFYLNAGMNRQIMESTLAIMPTFQTLRQGGKTTSGQFGYRFNCDEKSVIAAISTFHENL
jgi:hypothetical protein